MTQPAPAPAPQPPAPTPAPAPVPAAPAPAAPPAPSAPPQYVPPAPLAQPQYTPVPTPGQPVAPGAPQAPPTYVPVMPMPTPPPEPGDADKDISKLPQWAQKEITDRRAEAAKYRVSARTAVVNQHAYAAAGQLGVNPGALLGSVVFAQAAEQLDPNAADFPAKLTQLISGTLQANPWMAATPSPAAPAAPAAPPPTSGGEFPGGNPVGQPITEAQLATMTPPQIQEAYEKGQLKHLL